MKKKDLTIEELNEMVQSLCLTFDYMQNQNTDCITVIGKAIRNIGNRLEILEDHVYNNNDEDELDDDNYIN